VALSPYGRHSNTLWSGRRTGKLAGELGGERCVINSVGSSLTETQSLEGDRSEEKEQQWEGETADNSCCTFKSRNVEFCFLKKKKDKKQKAIIPSKQKFSQSLFYFRMWVKSLIFLWVKHGHTISLQLTTILSAHTQTLKLELFRFQTLYTQALLSKVYRIFTFLTKHILYTNLDLLF